MIKLLLPLAIILIIITLLAVTSINNQYRMMEHATFSLDTLQIPNNTIPINEIDTRRFIRLIGVEKHLKMDKYDRIEKMTYGKPKPELGETKCYRVSCPYWFSEVVCWKCI